MKQSGPSQHLQKSSGLHRSAILVSSTASILRVCIFTQCTSHPAVQPSRLCLWLSRNTISSLSSLPPQAPRVSNSLQPRSQHFAWTHSGRLNASGSKSLIGSAYPAYPTRTTSKYQYMVCVHSPTHFHFLFPLSSFRPPLCQA